MKIEQEILHEIEDFCNVFGVSEHKFGMETINDHKLVKRLREGGVVTSRTINSIRGYISDYKEELRKRVTIETCNEK